MKFIRVLAWAWIIIVGVLMITPNGIYCIACGLSLTKVLGVVSIVLGGIGMFTEFRGAAIGGQRSV